MGLLTRAQIASEAGLLAGNEDAANIANLWLDNWLQRTAKSWMWPVLKRQVYNLLLDIGATEVFVGTGYSTTTKPVATTNTTTFIHHIFNPLIYRSADYKTRGRLFINELVKLDPDKDPATTLAADRTGLPSTVRMQKATDGSFCIIPDLVTDRQLFLSFTAHLSPGAIASDSVIPWYPNDRTLVQAYKVALLELDDGGQAEKAFDSELAKLSAMVIDDRDFDGTAPGDNEIFQLDPGVFR